jgi:hypothetical protein
VTEVRDVIGELLPLGEPLELLDLGRGGFALESPFEFLTGTEHFFAFTLADGRSGIQLMACTVHCERVPGDSDSSARYRAGFSFVQRTPSDGLLIAALADARHIVPARSPS